MPQTIQESAENELSLRIGTEEATSLKAAKVRIEDVKIEAVGKNNARKVVCICKHPDKKDGTINISSVKYVKKDKLEVSGIWLNKDSEGKIKKGSALAMFLQHQNAGTMQELKGKEIDTMLDESGYLCFKAY